MPSKLRLEWRPQAGADLLEIISYIAENDPVAAQALKDEVERKVASLADCPKLHKLSPRVKGIREMVVRGNYIVFYREIPELVEIVSVVHARRHWPPVRKS